MCDDERLDVMEHDEAVAVLESLQEVARIEVVRLKPTDVIVLEVPTVMSAEHLARARATLQPLWPNNKIIVFEQGTTLKVVGGGA